MGTIEMGTQTGIGWTDTDLIVAALPSLRQTWYDAADMARDRKMPGLRAIVDSRLDRVAADNIADERTLLAIVDECQAMVAVVDSEESGELIGRMFRRGVYEYLLAIDARRHTQVEAERVENIDPPVASAMPFAEVDIPHLRRLVAEHLQEGRYGDCAAMLARVTQNQRGVELAEVACAAGRACRAAGEVRAAAACFQASCAADPEYEGSVKLGHAAHD